MNKILITGGAGAIGYHLGVYLADQGHQIFVVDNFCRSERDAAYIELINRPNVTEIKMDLCDRNLYSQLPQDVDYIYHLAAQNGTQNFYERPFDVLKNSTLPTVHLLDYYSQHTQLKRFVYAGSSEAYASSISLFNWRVPTAEDVPLGISDPKNVRWSYGGSKLHGELAAVAAGKQFNIPFTIARFHNAYGPRMGDKHVIPDFLERAKRGIFELFGYEDTRSFIYIDDAIRALVLVAESEKTRNEIVNIGGLPELTMLSLGKKMLALLGIQQEIICHPSPTGSVKRRAPDLKKLQQLTGFTQQISLDEGLRKTIDFYLS